MKIIHQPHDKLVGSLLKDKAIAIDFLKSQLPTKYLKHLDISSLEASSETVVGEKWKKYHNDIVFRCKTKKSEDTYIYILIEHQSTPDPFMPVRLLRYQLNVISKYLDAKKAQKAPQLLGNCTL